MVCGCTVLQSRCERFCLRGKVSPFLVILILLMGTPRISRIWEQGEAKALRTGLHVEEGEEQEVRPAWTPPFFLLC